MCIRATKRRTKVKEKGSPKAINGERRLSSFANVRQAPPLHPEPHTTLTLFLTTMYPT